MGLNKYFLVLVCVFFISSVSASLIITPTNLSVDKIVGTDKQVQFQVYNNDAFTYYNVSSNSPNLVLPYIANLTSGQTANITATLKQDTSGTFDYKIKGLYFTTVGNSHTTFNINITNYNGITPCDFSVIQGDVIKWTSKVSNNVIIKNTDTAQQIASLNLNETYTFNTASPLVLNYGLFVGGFMFSSCRITVLDGNGYVNDPQKDGTIQVKVNAIFNPTTITASFPITNYTLPITQTQDGVVTITNTGNKTAYGVHLEGDWFSFSSNDFTLAPNQIKPVVYTIIPMVYNTQSTNQTYVKQISITGNFNSINQSIMLYIPYADIGNTNTNSSDLATVLNAFCIGHPDSPFCNGTTKTIYKYINNGSDQEFNVSMSTQQVKDLWLYNIGLNDKVETAVNYFKESRDADSINVNSTSARLAVMEKILQDEKDAREQTTTNIIVFGSIMLIVFAIIVVCIIIYFNKKKNKMDALSKWGETDGTG